MKESSMARDGEIPAIFNPRRVRAPSVVVTGDSPNGPFGGFTPSGTGSSAPPQITHSDSVTSSQPDASDHTTALMQSSGGCQTPTPTTDHAATCIGSTTRPPRSRLRSCRDSCCSSSAQKIYFGICVTLLVTATWVGATHCIKFLYLTHNSYATLPIITRSMVGEAIANSSSFIRTRDSLTFSAVGFNAPFFASWFCTNFSIFFFPIYLLGRVAMKKCEAPGEILGDVLRGFRDRGFTVGRFLNRCLTFCILWLITTYLYALSLRALLATDVMALFATNVACVYLLSWVILHEQFVGVRIVAVILCDTGVALLAYMDGITGTPTLGGVVLAALAAAGYAVFKVMFKKVMGDPPVGEIAFTFSFLGFMNAALLWPVCIGLYLSGTEVMPWEIMPWIILLMASVLLLMFHLLTQFSTAITYNVFVTLGLITSVPVSAALDATLYGAEFDGMKLAGIILIGVGFFLVMLPDNWPDYITRLLRNIILLGHNARWGRHPRNGTPGGPYRDVIDYRTGYIRSHLRSPSGRVR
ncbi:putative thiamine transporter SLC35F3 isoform X2 [Phlebotomus papatasi]|uniref:putative thiamine transporter SLC35F3 isoform X2 n=1 Tax=Phlebotomus papatasi TaxID=29031 RepID=UPI0024837067|nr:putative thiamine transporter SLC35F3 isoform X2 [Phlebotomus papatasi]